MISAKIILGSVSPLGKKITTFELTYPRWIHAEVMTHRVFSRNSASSRAIKVTKMLARILKDMAMPIHWGKNQSGMQAFQEISSFKKILAKGVWRAAGYSAVGFASLLNLLGVHKQIANRICEPFSHITIVLTTTELDNFFELRDHKDAQPEIQELANKMKDAINSYEYKKLKYDDWHLPFVEGREFNDTYPKKMSIMDMIKISVACCARVSYLTHGDDNASFDKDKKLFDRLVGARPLHASPTEHQATPLTSKNNEKYQGNLVGWMQFRKVLERKMNGYNDPVISSIYDFQK